MLRNLNFNTEFQNFIISGNIQELSVTLGGNGQYFADFDKVGYQFKLPYSRYYKTHLYKILRHFGATCIQNVDNFLMFSCWTKSAAGLGTAFGILLWPSQNLSSISRLSISIALHLDCLALALLSIA